MANYHLHCNVISRSSGRSSTAAAAYRAAEKITDKRTGLTHDYSRKKGVVHGEILLPASAPEDYRRREILWNEVEKSEKRQNSRTARQIEVSLPRELSREEQIFLTREFVNKNFVESGMCADICIHDNDDGNPHAHIMLTTRDIDQSGFTTKNRDWNNRELITQWRTDWEERQNRYLKKYYEESHVTEEKREYVSAKSYAERGINRTAQVHEGARVTHIEKKQEMRCKELGIAYEPKTEIRRMNLIIAKLNGVGQTLVKKTTNIRDRYIEYGKQTFSKMSEIRTRKIQLWSAQIAEPLQATAAELAEKIAYVEQLQKLISIPTAVCSNGFTGGASEKLSKSLKIKKTPSVRKPPTARRMSPQEWRETTHASNQNQYFGSKAKRHSNER